MADNAFLDATEYANTMLLLLKNALVAGRLVNGQFKDQVTDENGLTINVKRPQQFVAQDGEALSLQPVVVGSVPVTVNQYKNVHVDVGDLEEVQSYNDLMKNGTMRGAASELAHTIDSAIHAAYLEFPSEVGTPGNIIGSSLEFNKAHTRLMDQSVPNSDISAVVSFDDGEEIRGQLVGTNIDGINLRALERTRIPIISEVDLFATNNGSSVTAGTRPKDTGPAVDGAAQNTNYRLSKDTDSQTIDLKGLGNALTLLPGDIFTMAGVFAVNNRSRQVLTYLKQFTVLTGGTSEADGTLAGVVISPAIIVGGTSDGVGTITNTAYQTCSAIPADSAAIIFNQAPGATYPVRVAFHKQAIALVSARLRIPYSDTSSFVSDPETGIGIRYWRGSDISTGRHIHRWDTIFGVKNVDRRMGVRVNGT